MISNKLKLKILNAFNFCYGIDLEGYDLCEDSQKVLGLIRSRQRQHEGEFNPVEIGYKEFRLLIGDRAPKNIKTIIEELERAGLVRIGPAIKGEKYRDFLLSKKVNDALKNPNNFALIRYPRKKTVKAPKIADLNFACTRRFGEIGLSESVIDLLDDNFSEQDFNTLANDVWRIFHGLHYSTPTKTGRESNLLNGIKTELRKFLTWDGKKLIGGDCKSCHAVLAYTYYPKFNLCPNEAARYKDAVCSHDFYSWLFKSINGRKPTDKERQNFKKNFNKWLNGGDDAAIRKAMFENFPVLSEKVEELNAIQDEEGKSNYNACYLQGLESSVIVKVGYELARDYNRPFISIHDGFLCLPEDFNEFADSFNAEFKKMLGFPMKIERDDEVKESGWIDPKALRDPIGTDRAYLDSLGISYREDKKYEYFEIDGVKWRPKTKEAKSTITGDEIWKFDNVQECVEFLVPTIPANKLNFNEKKAELTREEEYMEIIAKL